jgi:NADPH:quinone reductase-like Zn-dependent oxidoreductase
MNATEIVLPGTVEPEDLQVSTRELPEPGPGQAVVRVEATGVSFAEQQMRRGKYYDQPPFPFVPGYDLVPVPAGVEPAAAETVVVNGITALRMLHRSARVQPGQTIVVLGAAGGVGSTLVQLARHAGIRVIGTAGPSAQERVRALGAIPVDYRNEDVPARVRELAPDRVAAVFDHVGGPGIVASWQMLGRGGTLVSYGTASTRDTPGNPRVPVLKLFARLMLWNALPNGRRATFFNLWAGSRKRDRYRAQLRRDLGEVLALLKEGAIDAQIARRFALRDAGEALRYAERAGIVGKVVLEP